jgi:hypothetical protein
MTIRRHIACFVPLLVLTASVWAQRPGPGFDPSERLRQFDANKNGLIEPNEIPSEARSFLERMAERHGLDPKRPISIAKISEAIRRERGSRGGPPSRDSGDRDRRGDDRERDRERERQRDSASSSASHTESAVPGFGEETGELEIVPGFGGPLGPVVPLEKRFTAEVIRYVEGMFDRYDRNKNRVLDKAEWKDVRWRNDPNDSDLNKDGRLDKTELCIRIAGFRTSSSRSSSSQSSSRTSSPTPSSTSTKSSSSSSTSSRYRDYARSLLRQYDGNKNGVLEKSEYTKMKSSHQQADKNRDGRITLDELAGHLAGYSKSRSSSGDSSRSRSGSSSRGSSRGSSQGSSRGDQKTYRALSPLERLPSGLESWFTRKDVNGDGQVQMSEYSSVWSSSTIAEFKRHDRNGDGVITPEEHLTALGEK